MLISPCLTLPAGRLSDRQIGPVFEGRYGPLILQENGAFRLVKNIETEQAGEKAALAAIARAEAQPALPPRSRRRIRRLGRRA